MVKPRSHDGAPIAAAKVEYDGAEAQAARLFAGRYPREDRPNVSLVRASGEAVSDQKDVLPCRY